MIIVLSCSFIPMTQMSVGPVVVIILRGKADIWNVCFAASAAHDCCSSQCSAPAQPNTTCDRPAAGSSACQHQRMGKQQSRNPSVVFLISHMETKDFASSRCFVVPCSQAFTEGVCKKATHFVLYMRSALWHLLTHAWCHWCETSLNFIITYMSELIGFLCIDSNWNLWWEQIKGLFQWKVSVPLPPSTLIKLL